MKASPCVGPRRAWRMVVVEMRPGGTAPFWSAEHMQKSPSMYMRPTHPSIRPLSRVRHLPLLQH